MARAVSNAAELNLRAEELIGVLVEAPGVAAANPVVAVRALGPGLEADEPGRDFVKVRSPFDRICYRGEEHVRVCKFHVLDRGFDILNLLALVAPHQKHPGFNAPGLRERGRGAHLLDRHSSLHGVEHALRPALRADPHAEATEL